MEEDRCPTDSGDGTKARAGSIRAGHIENVAVGAGGAGTLGGDGITTRGAGLGTLTFDRQLRLGLEHKLHGLGGYGSILGRRLGGGHGCGADLAHFFDGSLGIPLDRTEVYGDFAADGVLVAIWAALVGVADGARVLAANRLVSLFVCPYFPVPGLEVAELLELGFIEGLTCLGVL